MGATKTTLVALFWIVFLGLIVIPLSITLILLFPQLQGVVIVGVSAFFVLLAMNVIREISLHNEKIKKRNKEAEEKKKEAEYLQQNYKEIITEKIAKERMAAEEKRKANAELLKRF